MELDDADDEGSCDWELMRVGPAVCGESGHGTARQRDDRVPCSA
jgi:hypothetical protein